MVIELWELLLTRYSFLPPSSWSERIVSVGSTEMTCCLTRSWPWRKKLLKCALTLVLQRTNCLVSPERIHYCHCLRTNCKIIYSGVFFILQAATVTENYSLWSENKFSLAQARYPGWGQRAELFISFLSVLQLSVHWQEPESFEFLDPNWKYDALCMLKKTPLV